MLSVSLFTRGNNIHKLDEKVICRFFFSQHEISVFFFEISLKQVTNLGDSLGYKLFNSVMIMDSKEKMM